MLQGSLILQKTKKLKYIPGPMSKKHVVGGRPSLRWDNVDKYIERDVMFVALFPPSLSVQNCRAFIFTVCNIYCSWNVQIF